MAKVAVKADVLQWALDRSNTSAESLRARFPKLKVWIAGHDNPTLKQLEDFAHATATPLGWLFLDEPPHEEVPIPYFRTANDRAVRRASADLLETIYSVQRRQNWARDYLIEYEGQSPLAFVNSATARIPAAEIANRMRRVLNLSDQWATQHGSNDGARKALRDAMEGAGIFVVINGVVGNNTSRPLKPEEFRGFVLVDEYAPFVFVNGADVPAAQMFTLAHELAHIFLGASAAFDLRNLMASPNATEQACNQAAAEFLVPATILTSIWPSVQNAKYPFNEIADRFKVSRIVAARRAQDLGLISRDEFLDFYRMYVTEKRKKRTGGDFYSTLPQRIGQRFGRTVVRAVREGVLPYTEAYSLTGVSGKTFDKYAENVE